MHKDIQTQHQWKFYAVPVGEFFPLGCKTTYRAYSADQVIEFVKQPKTKCLSKIGRYTVYCRWYPSALCDPNRRGVEGLYLLTRLPACPVAIGTIMAPAAFKVGSAREIQDCIIAVHQKWQAYDDDNYAAVEKWHRDLVFTPIFFCTPKCTLSYPKINGRSGVHFGVHFQKKGKTKMSPGIGTKY